MAKTITNTKVDAYINNAKRWREEMGALRTILLTCPFTEDFKWGKPCYTYQGNNVVMIIAFKEYCALSFLKGVLLTDASGILVSPGANSQSARQLRFTSVEEITALKDTIKAYANNGIAVEKAGLEVDFKRSTEFAIPEELQKKLDELPTLKEAFEALTPGRQRAYALYFTGPKQTKTREQRVERSIPRILAGKGLNDPME